MTEVPFLGLRIEGGRAALDDAVGMYELDENGYDDEANRFGVSTGNLLLRDDGAELTLSRLCRCGVRTGSYGRGSR